MVLTTRSFAAFVLAASIAVLGGALISQYWGGLAPCELCLLQRWPWRVAIGLGLIGVLAGPRLPLKWVSGVCILVFGASIAFAVYHVGVEQHWFAGPSACTAQSSGAMTLEDMKRQIMGAQAVLCDQVQWSLFGISLAGFNLLASLAMVAASLAAALRGRTTLSLVAASQPSPR